MFSPDGLLSTAGLGHQGRDTLPDGEWICRGPFTLRKLCSARPNALSIGWTVGLPAPQAPESPLPCTRGIQPPALWRPSSHGHFLLALILSVKVATSLGATPAQGAEQGSDPNPPPASGWGGGGSLPPEEPLGVQTSAQPRPSVHSASPGTCKSLEHSDASLCVGPHRLVHVDTVLGVGRSAALRDDWASWSPRPPIWRQGASPHLQGACEVRGARGGGAGANISFQCGLCSSSPWNLRIECS